MKKLLLVILPLCAVIFQAEAQDVRVNVITSPVSGCGLTAAEIITIEIENVGLTDLSAIPFSLSYSINAAPPVVEAVTFPGFLPNTTISYSFATTGDFSIPGLFTIDAACLLPGDINPVNDILTGYNVNNDAPTVGGAVAGALTVCALGNAGIVSLAGHTGTVNNWEYSIDGGLTWITITNTAVTQNFLNLTVTTQYRAAVQNGSCPEAFSVASIITVDQDPIGGSITPLTEVCETFNTGILVLSGETGAIVDWEISIDGGVTWTPIGNFTNTFTFVDLSVSTLYRAIIGNGSCATVNSAVGAVLVHPKPVPLYTVADVCFGNPSDFIDASTISSGSISFYLWDFDDGGSSVNVDPIHTYTAALTYTASLIAISDQGCADTVFINAIVNPLPSPTITPSGPTAFCAGGSLILSADSMLMYAWSTLDSTLSITVTASGWYILEVTDSITGCFDTDSIEVIINPVPVANAGNDTTISLGWFAELQGSGGAFFDWSPGATLDDSLIAKPIAYPLVTTGFELTVTDLNGCVDTDSVYVMVDVDYMFTPTNVVTPNGDGANDIWNIINIENYPDNHVAIYNRYGQELYQVDGYYLNEWDATFKGERVPDGTYYYVLTFDGSPKIFKGAITILGK